MFPAALSSGLVCSLAWLWSEGLPEGYRFNILRCSSGTCSFLFFTGIAVLRVVNPQVDCDLESSPDFVDIGFVMLTVHAPLTPHSSG